MKTLIILAVLATLALASPTDDQIFEDYLQTFKVRLGRSSIEKAKENVLKHHQEVQQHNEKFQKGEETFEAGLNEFSWKSDEQFSIENLGFTDGPHSNDSAPLPEKRSGRALPDYFNWVDRGVVRPVQNQGNCGSCYAFSAVAAIESAACIKKGQCAKLSEQEAMECTNGCNGGLDDMVYRYNCGKGGCASSSYSYGARIRSSCASASTRSRVSNTRVCSWYDLTGRGESMIRDYLYNHGPMFIAFGVYNNFYSYSSGIYSSTSGSYLGGHAVLLVGWGTQNGVPYWILKNSWGTGWGERGYFRMRRGVNLASIETWRVSVPIPV